jgi:triosephosphate isomerase
MLKDYKISEPFFEYGPKCYMYGETLVEMAKGLEKLAKKYNVNVVLDIPDTEIYNVARNVDPKYVHVYSQHMDSIPVGKGMGRTLPEALKAAGAVGVMLNHAEHKLTIEEIEAAIKRADEIGLATIVCADSVEEVKAIAKLGPNILVAEPTELIGTGTTSDSNYVIETIKTVNEINPDIMVLQGAGISNGQDVYNTIKLGAQATGSTSGILKAADPYAMVEEMIYNLRRAWNELHP